MSGRPIRVVLIYGSLALAMVLGPALAVPAGAGVYTYTDKDGVVHIQDRPEGDDSKLIVPSHKQRKGFTQPVVTGRAVKPVVERRGQTGGLPGSLVMAVIKTESNFNPKAVSPKGARGLMQLMPDTWKHYGVTDPFDPEQNVQAGTAYLKEQLDRFKRLDLALAAYNAGPANVAKYKGVPPFDETRRYVEKVTWYYGQYREKEKLVTLPGAAERFDQGARQIKGGDYGRAAAHFAEVVRRYPESAEANYNLALAYELAGRTQKAIERYKRALGLDPYCKEAYFNLAIIHEKMGHLDLAVRIWNRYLRFEVKPDERREVRKYISELEHLARQP